MSKVRNDIILAGILLLVAAVGFLLYGALQREGDYAVVRIDSGEEIVFSLAKDTEFVIKSNGGTNTLVIKDGKADIIHADCPDGICADHPPISKVGEVITCLPNKVTVSIRTNKSSDNGVDMVA